MYCSQVRRHHFEFFSIFVASDFGVANNLVGHKARAELHLVMSREFAVDGNGDCLVDAAQKQYQSDAMEASIGDEKMK